MIVTRNNFESVLTSLADRLMLSLDTETTGLRPYHGDEFFSIILHDGTTAYYFNFNDYPDVTEEYSLELPEYRDRLGRFFASNPERIWLIHNAKFDLAILRRAGWEVVGTVHDTMAVARVLDSTLFPNQFSLDECAKRIGYAKSDIVKTWLLKTKSYTEETTPGKKTKKKNLHFSLAPWDLIVPYGEQDGEITFRLGEYQRRALCEVHDAMQAARAPATVLNVFRNELELTRTVFEMESLGVLVDRDLCRAAVKHCEALEVEAKEIFAKIAGEPFKDSTPVYQRVFASDKDRWVYGAETATGKKNPSFDSDVLATFQNPAAKCVLDWRKAKSDANYYHGFLYEADRHGVIHASFNQHIAATGRFSSSNPNLQNLTKDEDVNLSSEFIVRRAIIPRLGNVFHMLDYDQMEYRLMLDYAARFTSDEDGVMALIAKVLGGLDVHQATADVAQIDRRSAKTVNFATLYGSGIKNLSGRLGVTEQRARDIRDSIFRAAPEIRQFIRRVIDTAEKRGYIVNWFGRKCSFPDAAYSYRAPNYIIQGGCADVVKVAMNLIHAACLANGWKTRLVLMVHDELVLEGPPDEGPTVIPEVKRIMESVYPHRFLPLTCGVDHSFKSLADKTEGIVPYAESKRRA